MRTAPAPQDVNLEILGAVHEDGATIFLLGPHEPGFWKAFTAAPEYSDGAPDPLDRWSKRVIGGLAADWGGMPVFPSDGPPYPPFIAWSIASGHAWQSPVGLLVHDRAGLMVSFRGAVKIPGYLPLGEPGVFPCDRCPDQPCRTACPAGALAAETYDVAACKSHLNGPDSTACMTRGCNARRACPISAGYGRVPAQSAFHMKAFNPR